ncbi:hypothetical protein, partial [Rhodothermus marinus]|uniref:hypothetical protein n=1 Tax=Rhodothermus marinus TaxID=29549 RepID=UPI001FB52D84
MGVFFVGRQIDQVACRHHAFGDDAAALGSPTAGLFVLTRFVDHEPLDLAQVACVRLVAREAVGGQHEALDERLTGRLG